MVTAAGAFAVAGSAVVNPVFEVPRKAGSALANCPPVAAVNPLMVGTVVAATIIPK